MVVASRVLQRWHKPINATISRSYIDMVPSALTQSLHILSYFGMLWPHDAVTGFPPLHEAAW